jgi:hypothetical protein
MREGPKTLESSLTFHVIRSPSQGFKRSPYRHEAILVAIFSPDTRNGPTAGEGGCRDPGYNESCRDHEANDHFMHVSFPHKWSRSFWLLSRVRGVST